MEQGEREFLQRAEEGLIRIVSRPNDYQMDTAAELLGAQVVLLRLCALVEVRPGSLTLPVSKLVDRYYQQNEVLSRALRTLGARGTA